MKSYHSELKSVTKATVLTAVNILAEGKRAWGIADQDGQLIGLYENQSPFFIEQSSVAFKKAGGNLHIGAVYRAYTATKFGNQYAPLYVLSDEKEESISETDSLDPIIAQMEELVIQCNSYLNKRQNPQTTDNIIDSVCFEVDKGND
ncbi:hypothetical protein A1QO_02565 [Vibrio genomosp. F10 str. ZF-129]|uniref:Uncharacterized protein n=1 Tax=Vibrio genomosp. F10 str. ZF-129 TaxID=1187848 RepID=A0A1E5BLF7_9VIBR|nr:hypothetical protein [Vibrio genomosp. F10]OEE38280.1 hypothetical protein A1QO_02565 [Vibrio genomosp. F10 str. ZF-129]